MDTDELKKFFAEFQDFLAPKLDTYEQAIYLYIFRHSRFVGKQEVVIAVKSERMQMALGVGIAQTPMSQTSIAKRLITLQEKSCVEVVQVEHKGTRIRLRLPSEILNCLPVVRSIISIDLEEIDFFNDAANRRRILERENFRCFYTLRTINDDSFVVEHVVSRPRGSNNYKNVVAASREANNKKGNTDARDFFRRLLREGYLSSQEFEERLVALDKLQAGELKPIFDVT